jgi:hypothetical protein
MIHCSMFGWSWSRNFHIFESLKPRAWSPGKMRRCGNLWDTVSLWDDTLGEALSSDKAYQKSYVSYWIYMIQCDVFGCFHQFNENERSTWMWLTDHLWSACTWWLLLQHTLSQLEQCCCGINCRCTVKVDTWLILPVVICLSQRLSHACLSINLYTVKLRMAH